MNTLIIFFVESSTRPHVKMCMRLRRDGPPSKLPPGAFQLQVTPAMSPHHFGRVSCVLGDRLVPPLHVEWRIRDRVCHDDELDLDASRLHASRVPITDECAVCISDSRGTLETAVTRVGVVAVPIVVEYSCTPASSDRARDGSASAVVLNAPASCLYLWSNGLTTRTPQVDNLSPGRYAVSLLGPDLSALVHVHAGAHAVVGVTPRA